MATMDGTARGNTTHDVIVIGFGKAGKTLAGALAHAGRRVALVEKDARMYGGTCINVACIPTKALVGSAALSAAMGGSDDDRAARYHAAIEHKDALTGRLRGKNLDKVVSAGVEVIDGTASFVGPHEVEVALTDGGVRTLSAASIVIDTGARPNMPDTPGLAGSSRSYVSETLLDLDVLPRRLAIVGGGYIGLEFASMYADFGSEVTIIQHGGTFLPREDAEVAEKVLESLEARGIHVLRGAALVSVTDGDTSSTLELDVDGGHTSLEADAILVATGRRPNVDGLGLESAGIELTERGAIKVDERLRTGVSGVWAAGDVVGGLQFTYVSLDDSRVILPQLLAATGDGAAPAATAPRTTSNRGAVPYSVFIDPPFSRVGLTEAQARDAGHEIRVARLAAAAIPKALVLGKPTGLLKVVIDGDTDLVLGAHLFCAESHELVNLLKLAIDEHVPYTRLRDAIYTHPTMSEAMNDLFAQVS
ncbi:MAG: FAD-dependent oxidoreductase [Atopobiaceae bacterium]|jgi:pyruvate/2-oxoglutarate dehydrogenase complex dihydrolipoamide dehydrogenase (E3) component|nr:FAD-dependent oxidoreductase [Atopobiaceae bacterium]MCI2174093.1 FAD-dependent oxidoreductase [Atopobiaceae bacterium]MCI2206734.1 FAD-dependent oxidoreductase [Atopobiaceae bacterium]